MSKDIDSHRLEYRTNEFGDIEQIDIVTGEIISSSRDEAPMPFTAKKANEVCDLVSEGKTLIEICGRSNMPDLRTIQRWKILYPLFREKLAAARKNFAEFLVEQAVMIGREGISAGKDEIAGMKLNIDTNIKIAEKYDKEQFGTTTKVIGDVNSPVVFKLLTGIPTQEDIEKEEAIEAEYKKVIDDDDISEIEDDVGQIDLFLDDSLPDSGEVIEEENSEW